VLHHDEHTSSIDPRVTSPPAARTRAVYIALPRTRPAPTLPGAGALAGRAPWWDPMDLALALFMQRHGMRLLRVSIAIVYIWFGILKPFHLSPAVALVVKTTAWIPIPPRILVPLLGWWEVAIGVGFLYRPLTRAALLLLCIHVLGTALPLLLLPHVCFAHFPYAPTLEGQYIIKNLTLISAAIVVGGTVRLGAVGRAEARGLGLAKHALSMKARPHAGRGSGRSTRLLAERRDQAAWVP
jgi:uncharacterized membrane protein YkgB